MYPVSQRLSATDIVELFEKDVRARKRLAELLVSEPDVRLAIINAVLRDVATKSDIEKLRNEMRQEIEKLEKATKSDIDKLRTEMKQEIDKLRNEMSERFEKLSISTKSDIEKLRTEMNDRFEKLSTATKQDIESLRDELRREFNDQFRFLENRLSEVEKGLEALRREFMEFREKINERIARLEGCIEGLEKRVDLLTKVMLMINAPILIAVIGILLKMLLAP